MNAARAINVQFNIEHTQEMRLRLFLGHYDLRVYVTRESYIDVGSGSFGCIFRIHQRPNMLVGSLGSIGRYCEMANDARLIVGGEHNNDNPINVTLTGFPMLALQNPDLPNGLPGGLHHYRPLRIGNGVVLSEGVRVLPGAAIGDGAVVGAGSIVTRDVDAYTIVAGAPARPLRKRAPAQSWWDWDPDYILANVHRLQQLAVEDGPHIVRPERPRFIVNIWQGITVTGLVADGREQPIAEAPRPVQDYAAQAMAGDKPFWHPDCWEE